MDHAGALAAIDAETRARLHEKSDRAGGVRLAAHLVLILIFGAWVAMQAPLWPLAMLPLGLALAFTFTLQHECTHKTPFATAWVNEAVGHACAVILVQPFEWFRWFHMAHHRFTNDLERDPELAGTEKPGTWGGFLWHLSTLGYWRDKAVTLATNAVGPPGYIYLPTRAVPRIRREARFMLALYAAALLFTLFVSPVLLRLWLIPVILGFPVLRLYLLVEHALCPHVPDMLANSRTTLTTRLVRLLAWNMPYHAEHHAAPNVPFHRLPELHNLIHTHLKSVANGYGAFTAQYLKGLK